MSWMGRLLGRAPQLDSRNAATLEEYRSLLRPDLRMPLGLQRMVVLDVETSGLDPFRDRLISIGAIAVNRGLVRFDDAFEVVLKQAESSDHGNILVHGIGGAAQLSGSEPVVAMLDFLRFAGKAPLVCFNAGFDRTVIERTTATLLGIRPHNDWVDLAVLLPALFPRLEARTLDDWMKAFGIENYSRHDALADALATAQLLLVVLAETSGKGVASCADLIALERSGRWLGS